MHILAQSIHNTIIFRIFSRFNSRFHDRRCRQCHPISVFGFFRGLKHLSGSSHISSQTPKDRLSGDHEPNFHSTTSSSESDHCAPVLRCHLDCCNDLAQGRDLISRYFQVKSHSFHLLGQPSTNPPADLDRTMSESTGDPSSATNLSCALRWSIFIHYTYGTHMWAGIQVYARNLFDSKSGNMLKWNIFFI